MKDMRGEESQQESMFSYVPLERRISADHPLRKIRVLVDVALKRLEPVFAQMYSERGRPSIAPERLIEAAISQQLLLSVVEQARERQLLSEEHFTVDGTLIQAWANRRSFKEKIDPPDRGTGARGRKLLRDTHESTTDPEARLYRKSASGAVVPSYLGHLITENRHGLIVAAMVTQAGNSEERQAALAMLPELKRKGRMTLGADKSYQEEKFICALRWNEVTPHVAEYAPNPKWPNWLTEQERNDPGMALSQKKRKLVEKSFGWMKQDRPMRQVKLRGVKRVDWLFGICAAAHNLLRLSKLIPIPAAA